MTDTATEAPQNQWDANASFWVQIIRENRDKYRNDLTDPAMLRAIGEPSNITVLDAGCGEGYLSRMLAKRGATVTGVDSSKRLIEAARTRSYADVSSVSFDVASVDELPYSDGTFDLVVCNHLVNDLYDPSGPINEFARVLHNDGRLIILYATPVLLQQACRARPDHQWPSCHVIL
jgi:2-polyprenyl-3-methyl-5-hydroxy-6-metoxy-1,4-benzoquinol methylase